MTFLKVLLFIALSLVLLGLNAVFVILALFYMHEAAWPSYAFYPAGAAVLLLVTIGFATIAQWLARRLV